jgi:hypothetical protein
VQDDKSDVFSIPIHYNAIKDQRVIGEKGVTLKNEPRAEIHLTADISVPAAPENLEEPKIFDVVKTQMDESNAEEELQPQLLDEEQIAISTDESALATPGICLKPR